MAIQTHVMMHLILINITCIMNNNVYQHKNQIKLIIFLITTLVNKGQTYVLK